MERLLDAGELRDYAQVRSAAVPEPIAVPTCEVTPPDLESYDDLMDAAGGDHARA